MELKREILLIISGILSDYTINEDTVYQNLQEIGINSITFVKIVIAIEEKYDIEFDYEMLAISSFSTLKSIIEYVERKINE